ncbi:transcriptional repressor [Solirubrobacter sp. CPCC 204708]|nr:transcriptional repressor [Solirubrobacter deserti]
MDRVLRDQWLEQADETLSSNGRRAGPARTAIVELFAREGQCLLSAHDILERLPTASPSSVYRTLEELYGLKLLSRFIDHDGVARYEIAHPRHHHHHFIDEATGSPTPFTDEGLEQAINDVARRLGVTLSGHDVVIRGHKVVNGTES